MAKGFNIDVDVPKVVTVGVVSVLLLVVTLIATSGFYLKYEREEFAEKNYRARSPLVAEVTEKADAHLHRYRWVNEERTAAQLPIDRAISLMAETKGRPPTTQPLGSVRVGGM